MAQMMLTIPQTLVDLPEQERALLLRAGLYEAERARARQLEAEVAEAEAQVQRFQARYGMPLSRFETEALPALDTWQVHEDYNDWFFWQSVWADKNSLLHQLHRVSLG
jgi:hypothetical protein